MLAAGPTSALGRGLGWSAQLAWVALISGCTTQLNNLNFIQDSGSLQPPADAATDAAGSGSAKDAGDAAPSATADASSVATDAGPLDGGPSDAAALDGASDAAPDGATDSGSDAGQDGGLDAGGLPSCATSGTEITATALTTLELDGNLTEWSRACWYDLPYVQTDPNLGGDGGTGRFALMYSADALYLAIDVPDVTHVCGNSGAQSLYVADSVQVALERVPALSWPYDYEFGWALCDATRWTYRWKPNDRPWGDDFGGAFDTRAVYELRLAATEIGGGLGQDPALRIALAVNDCDGPANTVRGHFESVPGIVGNKSAAFFQTVVWR